jgi:hypothetical protein
MANSVSNAIFLPIKILAPLFFITTLNFANSDTLNYYFLLYQQTTYLENALMPGSWWSNPASTAEIERKTAQTVDVTPLGNVLTIASAKFLMPVTSRFSAGIGIMGVGQGNSSSQNLNATGSGATFQSQSSFFNPSMQFSGAAKFRHGGGIGLLFNIGAEQLPSAMDLGPTYSNYSNYLTMGFGAGLLTPWFFERVSLGLSAMSTGHFWIQNYWDYDGKLALRFRSIDSLLTGYVESTFSFLGGNPVWIGYSPNNYYEVIKAMISLRFMGILGLLLGYSDDVPNGEGNGQCAHVGLELKQSNLSRYYGGYEIGIALTTQLPQQRDLLVHRFWVGYNF